MRNEGVPIMKKIKMILVFCVITAAYAFAETGETMNLEQARTLALANSRSIARYNMAIESSILDEKSQLYTMLPSVSANYSASMSYMDRNWGFVNPIDTFTSGFNFEITQKIFEGGKSFVRKALSSISTESARLDALAEYYNVLDTVDSAYYAVLEAAANLEASESTLQTAVLSLSIAEIRQRSGMINQGDYLKAQADKESRENSRNQSRRNASLIQAKFKSLVGISELPELEPIDFNSYDGLLNFLSGISDDDANAMYERFLNLLARSNPSLARAALSNQRAEKNLSLVKRDTIPSISATIISGDISWSSARGFGTSSGGGVYLRGTIPIDFWVLDNKIKKSKIDMNNAALNYINMEKSLETELYSDLLDIFARAESVLSTRRTIEYTDKHLEYVMERFRLSQGSVSDLTDALALAGTNRLQAIRAEYGFLQSLSKLRSLGAIDDEQRLMEIIMGSL